MNKGLKIFLIIVSICAAAVFTGPWIFRILGHVCDFISIFFDWLKIGCNFLSNVFILFGWQGGILKW